MGAHDTAPGPPERAMPCPGRTTSRSARPASRPRLSRRSRQFKNCERTLGAFPDLARATRCGRRRGACSVSTRASPCRSSSRPVGEGVEQCVAGRDPRGQRSRARFGSARARHRSAAARRPGPPGPAPRPRSARRMSLTADDARRQPAESWLWGLPGRRRSPSFSTITSSKSVAVLPPAARNTRVDTIALKARRAEPGPSRYWGA